MSGTITRVNNDIIETYQGQDPQGDVGDSGVLSALAENTPYARTLDSFKTSSNTWDQALQNAFSYFGSKGGELLLGANIYTLSPFVMPPRISIKGQGRSISIIKQLAGTVGHFITFTQNTLFSRLQDLTIDANSMNCPNGSDGIYFDTVTAGFDVNIITDNTNNTPSSATYSTLDNIIVINAKVHGIEIKSAYWGTFYKNIFIRNSGQYGIYCTSTDLIFDTINSEFNQSAGIFDAGGNNRWSNCKCIFNGQGDSTTGGFCLYGNNRSMVMNVDCQDNYCDGMHITNCNSLVLSNIVLDGNGRIYGQSDPTDGSMAGNTNCCGLKVTNSKNFTLKGVATNYKYPSCYIQNKAAICDVQSTNYNLDLKQVNQFASSSTIVNSDGNTVILTANTTSVTVTHNLGYQPYCVTATPYDNVGYVWINSLNSTSFKINTSASNASNIYIAYTCK